jgi:hypothetical protein
LRDGIDLLLVREAAQPQSFPPNNGKAARIDRLVAVPVERPIASFHIRQSLVYYYRSEDGTGTVLI